MFNTFNILTLFILIIFSIKTFALESTDQMKTQILKIYDRNILVLNRGAEDGVVKNDHIKMTSNEGFIARGICMRVNLLSSHWKIYRVIRPELVSKDTEYTLLSINQSEVPSDLKSLKQVNFTKYITKLDLNSPKKQIKLQQKRIAKYDLPTSIDSLSPKDKKLRNYIKSNIEKAREEMNYSPRTYMSFYASPISWQTRFEQKETNYGLNIRNRNAAILFNFNVNKSERKIIDPVTESGYSSDTLNYRLELEHHRLTNKWYLTSHYDYFSEKIGDTYYPKARKSIGLLGIKYYAWKEQDEKSYFTLSYIPVIENLIFTSPITAEDDVREGIRNQFKISVKTQLSKTISNETNISYAPYFDSGTNTVSYSDTNTNFQTNFSFRLVENFYMDYLFNYEQDEFRSKTYGISNDNTTQTLRFRYKFML